MTPTEALQLVKDDLEVCDWHCVNCGRDFRMTETDIYMHVTDALNKPKEDVAANNVVALRPALASAGDAPAGSSAGPSSVEARPTPDQHRAVFAGFAPEFGDPETLFNSRDWLQAALEAKGAKITGGGTGLGQADLDIELEGCKFNVSLRPIA